MRILDARLDRLCAQMGRQIRAIGNAYNIQMINVMGIGCLAGQLCGRYVAKGFSISRSERPPMIVPLVQIAKFNVEDSALNAVHPVISPHFDVVKLIALSLSVIAQAAQALC